MSALRRITDRTSPPSVETVVRILFANAAGMSDLIRRAQQGDRASLEHLFTKELPLLRRYAQTRVPRCLGPAAEPEHSVKTTAPQVLGRLPHLKAHEHASLQPYLRKTLIHLVRNE